MDSKPSNGLLVPEGWFPALTSPTIPAPERARTTHPWRRRLLWATGGLLGVLLVLAIVRNRRGEDGHD